MNYIADFTIHPAASLREALIKMTSSKKGILFAVNKQGQLEGALSDGDVRRVLIYNVTLATPISKIMNINPASANSVEEAKASLRAQLSLLAVPILDGAGKIVQLAVLQDDETIQLIGLKPQPLTEQAKPRPKKVLALIPARGGSKRIPKKNLAKIANYSLLGLAIKVLQESSLVDEILVSTDDDEIAEEARKFGVEVPWMRPPNLASDTAKSIDVVLDAFEKFQEANNYLPEIGLLIEPTAPLRTVHHIDQAIRTLQNSDADSVISINQIPHNYHPEELLVTNNGQVKPYLDGRNMDTRKLRGEQEPVYIVNGLVYAYKVKSLMKLKSFYGKKTTYIETAPESFLDIDTQEDLKLAQLKLKQQY